MADITGRIAQMHRNAYINVRRNRITEAHEVAFELGMEALASAALTGEGFPDKKRSAAIQECLDAIDFAMIESAKAQAEIDAITER